MFQSFCICIIAVKISYSVDVSQGWNYINLNCRDNENKPVDWWYMYKPPINVVPFTNFGRNFSFITSNSKSRWESSDRHITANTMLQHTLSPIFRPTYKDYLAVVAYESQKRNSMNDLPERGVIMAEEQGGVWIGHTVPGLLNFSKDRPSFPENESANGHLLTCLSLDLVTLNEFVMTIRQMSPRYTRIQMPMAMRSHLPAWNFLDGAAYKGYKMHWKGHVGKTVLDFVTRNKSMNGTLMVRKPGDKGCIYRRFAQKNRLIMDVYGRRVQVQTMCKDDFGVRKIDLISINTDDFVYYVKKNNNHLGFAVSTAAHWQRTGGSGSHHFWTCTGGLNDLAVCVEEYIVWLSFDRLKVKEPEC